MRQHPWISDLLDSLVSGELKDMLSEHYHSLLHEVAERSVSTRSGLRDTPLYIAYRVAKKLGLVREGLASPAQLTQEMNILSLLDIIYRGPEYASLINELDDEGKTTLALYIYRLACLARVSTLCNRAKEIIDKRCRLLRAIKSRIRIITRLSVRHTSNRQLLLIAINDPIGPHRLVTDSPDIVVESIATITPRYVHKISGGTRSLAVLDVGAYNGETSTRYAAVIMHSGVKGTVYAAEPDPIAYKVLEHNAHILGYPIKTINAFLGSSYGFEILVPRGPSSAMSRIAKRSGKIRVQVIPAHIVATEALEATGAKHLHVRIDTEGAEDIILSDLLDLFRSIEGFSVEVAVYHRLGDILYFHNKLRDLATKFTLTWSSCDFRDLMLVAYREAL